LGIWQDLVGDALPEFLSNLRGVTWFMEEDGHLDRLVARPLLGPTLWGAMSPPDEKNTKGATSVGPGFCGPDAATSLKNGTPIHFFLLASST
jgi:hypothetical protein